MMVFRIVVLIAVAALAFSAANPRAPTPVVKQIPR
jgi:hypothetical protein